MLCWPEMVGVCLLPVAPWNFKINMTLPEHSSSIAEEQTHGLELH